jgi:hypothetical protein
MVSVYHCFGELNIAVQKTSSVHSFVWKTYSLFSIQYSAADVLQWPSVIDYVHSLCQKVLREENKILELKIMQEQMKPLDMA